MIAYLTGGKCISYLLGSILVLILCFRLVRLRVAYLSQQVAYLQHTHVHPRVTYWKKQLIPRQFNYCMMVSRNNVRGRSIVT